MSLRLDVALFVVFGRGLDECELLSENLMRHWLCRLELFFHLSLTASMTRNSSPCS